MRYPTSDQNDYPRSFVGIPQYSPMDPKELALKSDPWKKSRKGKTQLYHSSSNEYDLLNMRLDVGGSEVFDGVNGSAVFVITKGEVMPRASEDGPEETLREGQVIFVKPGHVGYRFYTEGKAEMWGAFVEA